MSASAGPAESWGSTARQSDISRPVRRTTLRYAQAAGDQSATAAVGVPPGACAVARRRLDDQQQTGPQVVARGGLRVPARKRKRQRLGISTVPASRLAAQRPNHVWALDFQWDQTADARNLKLLNVVDEYTREALEILVERHIDADATVRVLERLTGLRGCPEHVRCDNGPELTAHALRDWCKLSGAGTAFIEPGSPWQNAYVESFNGRLRDELLDVEQFSCLAEAKVVIEDWRQDYNAHRPHSSLGILTPTAYAASLILPTLVAA